MDTTTPPLPISTPPFSLDDADQRELDDRAIAAICDSFPEDLDGMDAWDEIRVRSQRVSTVMPWALDTAVQERVYLRLDVPFED